jgi:SAM-dependent methyltransferase
MNHDQRDRIIKRHRHSLWMYGQGPQALYWENSAVQTLRFDTLLSCGIRSGDSVLDVGCGLADLYPYMKGKGIDVDYTGIDLSPDLIDAARARAPDLSLYQGDLFDFNPVDQAYDWVLLSGALNEPLQDEGAYVHAMLPRLYAACRKGLAFNLLNADFEWTAQQRCILQAYRPVEIMARLDRLSSLTRLSVDYLDVDASYFVWREEPAQPRS